MAGTDASAPAKAVVDPKSPPKAQRSHRALSQRAMQHSHREPEHEAFGLEPPPTQREIASMMVVTAVRTLSEFGSSSPETVEQVCERCFSGQTNEKRQEAADAGAVQAIVACMGMHPDNLAVQEKCILALGNICCGTDERGLARKQLAADAGALAAVLVAMRSHLGSSIVQENGSATVGNIASHVDDPGLARKSAAIEEGALEAVVSGMRAHPTVATVQSFGSFCLANLTRARGEVEATALGADRGGTERKEKAAAVGAIEEVVKAMAAHADDASVQELGARALANITHRSEPLRKKAVESGARTEWLDGAVTAR